MCIQYSYFQCSVLAITKIMLAKFVPNLYFGLPEIKKKVQYFKNEISFGSNSLRNESFIITKKSSNMFDNIFCNQIDASG